MRTETNRMKERPMCHRAEDLVSHLYGELAADEAHDFAQHIEQCESCKAEFASFSHVHQSITSWRNEALGSVGVQAASTTMSALVANELKQSAGKRSARAAVREFFAISPLWLRGATALATLLLLALALLAVSRMWTRAPQLSAGTDQKTVSESEFREAVNKAVEQRMNALKKNQPEAPGTGTEALTAKPMPLRSKTSRPQIARSQPARLTPQERQQLAADLRLIPGREDDLPFVFSDEPEE
jgi:hypothetical protein